MARFAASFECDREGSDTRVTRTLEFRFTPAVRWLFEPMFTKRLAAEVRLELDLAKQHFEQR